jgi:hypothetical protein
MDLALGELILYGESRNALTRIHNKWMRIGNAPLVPEYQTIAQDYRNHPPKTGRRPTLRCLVQCTGRRIKVHDDDPSREEKLQKAAGKACRMQLTQSGGVETKLDKLRESWGLVEVLEHDRQRYRVRCSQPKSARSLIPSLEKWIKASAPLDAKLDKFRKRWGLVEVLEQDHQSYRVRCSQPRSERARTKSLKKWVKVGESLDAKLDKLREHWGLVEVLEQDQQLYRVRCSQPKSARPQSLEKWIKASESLDAKLDKLREKWVTIEIQDRDQGRSDHAELRAADMRAVYGRHVEAGGYYGTFHLANEAVASAAKATEARDSFGRLIVRELRESETSDDGRAAIDLSRFRWDEQDPWMVEIHGTRWSCHRDQLMGRPRTPAQEAVGRERDKLDPRRPPTDARVVRAHLQRDRMSPPSRLNIRWNWYLVLTLDCDSPEREVSEERTEAGLDLCWRQTDDGLSYRVAYLADSRGREREITVPRTAVSALLHYEHIKSLADLEADRLRKILKLSDRTGHRTLVQRALERDGQPSPDYRDRDSSTWNASEIAHHMIHLDEYAHHGRSNALAQRDGHYLHEIHTILREQKVIYCEDMEGDKALVTKEGGGKARDQRQQTAPFTFLRLLQREAPKFGAVIELREPAYTSRICDVCGHDMGASSQLWRRCQKCGTRHDVDALAARNIRCGVSGPVTPELQGVGPHNDNVHEDRKPLRKRRTKH